MKKLILVLIISAALLVSPRVAFAEDQICTQVYGGGVVCGAHTPVNTGVADNLGIIGFGTILASGIFFFISRKVKQIES